MVFLSNFDEPDEPKPNLAVCPVCLEEHGEHLSWCSEQGTNSSERV